MCVIGNACVCVLERQTSGGVVVHHKMRGVVYDCGPLPSFLSSRFACQYRHTVCFSLVEPGMLSPDIRLTVLNPDYGDMGSNVPPPQSVREEIKFLPLIIWDQICSESKHVDMSTLISGNLCHSEKIVSRAAIFIYIYIYILICLTLLVTT